MQIFSELFRFFLFFLGRSPCFRRFCGIFLLSVRKSSLCEGKNYFFLKCFPGGVFLLDKAAFIVYNRLTKNRKEMFYEPG